MHCHDIELQILGGYGLTDKPVAQEPSIYVTQILALADINSFLLGRAIVVPALGSIHVPSEALWAMMENSFEK